MPYTQSNNPSNSSQAQANPAKLHLQPYESCYALDDLPTALPNHHKKIHTANLAKYADTPELAYTYTTIQNALSVANDGILYLLDTPADMTDFFIKVCQTNHLTCAGVLHIKAFFELPFIAHLLNAFDKEHLHKTLHTLELLTLDNLRGLNASGYLDKAIKAGWFDGQGKPTPELYNCLNDLVNVGDLFNRQTKSSHSHSLTLADDLNNPNLTSGNFKALAGELPFAHLTFLNDIQDLLAITDLQLRNDCASKNLATLLRLTFKYLNALFDTQSHSFKKLEMQLNQVWRQRLANGERPNVLFSADGYNDVPLDFDDTMRELKTDFLGRFFNRFATVHRVANDGTIYYKLDFAYSQDSQYWITDLHSIFLEQHDNTLKTALCQTIASNFEPQHRLAVQGFLSQLDSLKGCEVFLSNLKEMIKDNPIVNQNEYNQVAINYFETHCQHAYQDNANPKDIVMGRYIAKTFDKKLIVIAHNIDYLNNALATAYTQHNIDGSDSDIVLAYDLLSDCFKPVGNLNHLPKSYLILLNLFVYGRVFCELIGIATGKALEFNEFFSNITGALAYTNYEHSNQLTLLQDFINGVFLDPEQYPNADDINTATVLRYLAKLCDGCF